MDAENHSFFWNSSAQMAHINTSGTQKPTDFIEITSRTDLNNQTDVDQRLGTDTEQIPMMMMMMTTASDTGSPLDDFYDLSQIPYPLPMKSVPLTEALLKVIFCAVIMAVAIFGNSAVILTVWKKKRLRSTTNYYIVNLAVSDLLVTISCTWVQVVHNLTEGWQLGAFFCKFNSFAQGKR